MLYTNIMWVSSRYHPHSSSISFCAINSYTSKNKIKIIMGTTTNTYLRFNGGRLILLFRIQSYSGHVWCKFVQVLPSHIGNKYCIYTRVRAHRISLRRLVGYDVYTGLRYTTFLDALGFVLAFEYLLSTRNSSNVHNSVLREFCASAIYYLCSLVLETWSSQMALQQNKILPCPTNTGMVYAYCMPYLCFIYCLESPIRYMMLNVDIY